MGVYALVAGKGAPGATTTFVGLVRAWRAATGRLALGLDLDPYGGDVAAGPLLGAAPSGAGVLALATDRAEDPLQALLAASVLLDESGSRVVPGVPDAARSGAIALAWDLVAAASPGLAANGMDVLIDGGRFGDGTPAPSWLADVDLGVLVVRPSLPWVASAHRVALSWPESSPLGLVVVDAPSPYSSREVARAVGRPTVGVLPFDPRAASVHSDGARPERNHRRGSYARALDRLAQALVERRSDDEDERAEHFARHAGSALAAVRSLGEGA